MGVTPPIGSLVKMPNFKRERAGQLAVDVDGTAAHARNDAGVLHLGPVQLDQDDRLLRPHQIGQDANHGQIEFFDLVARKDGVGHAGHAGFHLVERKYGRAVVRKRGARNDGKGQNDGREENTPRCQTNRKGCIDWL